MAVYTSAKVILGMGFEPMRFATADLKPASLTNSDILVAIVFKETIKTFYSYKGIKALAGIEPALRGSKPPVLTTRL